MGSIQPHCNFSNMTILSYIAASPELHPRERTIEAMQHLAWPVFQGAASTVLGVLTLAFVDSYLVNVFFKNIVLVITFGVTHALVSLNFEKILKFDEILE